MPTDYEELTRTNEEDLGKKRATRASQVTMYSDWTHFIFEILQNADDYGAKTIRFEVTEDELVIEHDGSPFKEENVKAITYFHGSTSKEDLVKTGRFGLGFKSVFCFTATPIIHSGEENFEIYDLYSVKAAPRPENLPRHLTRIRLPFNNAEHEPEYLDKDRWMLAEEACSKITKKLNNLDPTTILFTSSLLKIKYVTPELEGSYQRRDSSKEQVNDRLTMRRSTIMRGEDEDEIKEYLLFSRSIEFDGKKHKPVDIAFQLNPATEEREENIITADEKRLFVLFPTEQETKMGFSVNGPYQTPPNRENIENALDNKFNAYLIQETCELVCECLPKIRDMDLLDVHCLNTLPIDFDDFPENDRFRPMFDKVRKTLETEELLPTEDGSHVAGKNAKLVRGKELINLLSNDQLTTLFKSRYPLKWLTTDITEGKTPDLYRYLMGKKYNWESEIPPSLANDMEIAPETFINKLTRAFLKEQEVPWFKEFYLYMTDRRALDDAIKSKPCILLKDGNLVTPVDELDEPNAYFPSRGETKGYAVIDSRLVEDEDVRDYLARIGVSKIDAISNIIKNVLPRYYSDSVQRIPPEQYRKDLQVILEAYKTDSRSQKNQILEKLKEIPFFPAENAASPKTIHYKLANEIYLPSKDLRNYFHGNEDAWFLIKEIVNFDEDLISDLLDELEINKKPKPIKEIGSGSGTGFEYIPMFHRRGFEHQYDIDGIEKALGNVKEYRDLAKYIWELLINYMDNAKIEFRGILHTCPNAQFPQDHPSLRKHNIETTLFKALSKHAWILDRDGNLHKPSVLTLDDLPDAFEKNEKLATEIGMKGQNSQELVDKLAKEMGIDDLTVSDVEAIKRNKEAFDEWKKTQEEPPPFPSKKSNNPERRKEKLREEVSNAPERSTSYRETSVRTTRGNVDPATYLRQQYTINEKLVCQVCQNVMPFKKPDQEYYFEAVEICTAKFFSEELNSEKELKALYLALCPVCAARYKIFVKGDIDAMRDLIRDMNDHDENDDECEFSIEMGLEESTVRFTLNHLFDIRAILELGDE
jgi:hypothetical protein